jgi:integrase
MKKPKPPSRILSDNEIVQREIELLQNLYGHEEGKRRYEEIQRKVKEDLEQSKKESWHEREKRKEQERIERWIGAYQRMSMAELLGLRELFEKDVKVARKAALHNPRNEEASLEAKAKLDAVVYLINNPGQIEVKKTKIEEDTEPVEQYMFSEFKKSYIEHVKTDKAPKTLENVERVFKHFEAFFGDKSISEFVPEDLEKYKASRKGKVRDVTINNEIRTIKAAFQKAVDWGRLKEHPFGRIKQIRVPEEDARPFTKDEFKKLCNVIKDDSFLRIVKFAVLTGMRRGEILNLRWENIDISKKKITVVSSGEHRVKHGKMRKIPINDEVVGILEKVKNDSDYVFINKQKRPYNDDTVTKKFKDYIRMAKLPDELHFHSLRETFASWGMSEGISHYAMKQLLGHASVKTTEGYSIYDDDRLSEDVSRIKLPSTVEKKNQDQ